MSPDEPWPRREHVPSRSPHQCRGARARRGSPDYGPQSSRSSRLLRIDQDEGDAAGLAAAIDPGVIGALLHQDVSRLQVNLRIVEQHVDLAGHDDGIIHLASPMHGWMA